MPLLRIQTNLPASDALVRRVMAQGTELVMRELGKPKEFIQVMLETEVKVQFAGENEPNAFVELRSLGLPRDKTGPLSAGLCDLLCQTMGIPGNRVFINFLDMPRTHWGWNGKTFG